MRILETNILFLELVRLWTVAFKKRPWLTGSLTALTAVLLITLAVIQGIRDARENEQRRIAAENARRQNLDLHTQLKRLDEVQQSLLSLLAFVQHQQDKIKVEQNAIIELETQKANLEPVVRLQQEQIDKLFGLQERRIAKQRQWDLAIGFGLGILGSMTASLVIMTTKTMWRKHRDKGSSNTG